VIFKDQLASLPATTATVAQRIEGAKAAQAGTLAELDAVHAKHVRGFSIVNAIAATMTSAVAARLRADPAIQAAVAAGVTVVASRGDAGPFNNIGSPATTPGVIAVGGTTRPWPVRSRTTARIPGLSADDAIRHAAVAGRMGEQQHHGAQLGWDHRVQRPHGRRGRAW
jgi:hypothetical protein